MFDRSFLPEADLEFVVMTDTHYMLDPGGHHVEFESRRRQAARAAHALGLIASLDAAFVVHGGDLVQEFPESDGFAKSVCEALAQFEAAGVRPRQVAGNHDVGDKPDPTMPTDWVTEESLRQYHERFGTSWYSWDAKGCHFVVLNSQIMNGPLPEAGVQQRWLEEDLEAHAGMPTCLFLHLAPFLCREDEDALGHYDNINEPARSWLLGLVRTHDVRMVFSGHSHFSFFNRVGDGRLRVVPSTAFTRPGFCEVFSSAPPPERGRDDTAKLGFLLVRVRDGRAGVHLIRTKGAMGEQDGQPGERRVISGTSHDLYRSGLGITLRHPLAPTAEVPIAWQSTIRQPVRNDYPLLACDELGVRHLRAPASDLASDEQRERLTLLKDQGVTLTATWIWSDRTPVFESASRHRVVLDGVEVQLPGRLTPDAACLRELIRCSTELSLPVHVAPLLPREMVKGKQHARTRIGYHLDELPELDRFLNEHDATIDRVLCRVHAAESPWDAIAALHGAPGCARIGAVDWAVEFADADERTQANRAAEALFATASLADTRVYMEPLIDLDRTMDAPLGLLDRLCNPREAFHAVRMLNTILHSEDRSWAPFTPADVPGARVLGLQDRDTRVVLILPTADGAAPAVVTPRALYPEGGEMPDCRVARLVGGVTESITSGAGEPRDVAEPTLVIFGNSTRA